MAIIWLLGSLLFVFSLVVIFNGDAYKFFEDKKDFLEFVLLGISGLIALYGLVVLNRRAAEQVKTNQLMAKGLSQERFKTAIEHLADSQISLRIASFHEFYYLVRDNKEEYGQNVLEILCEHLRQKTKYPKFDITTYPLEECPPEEVHTEEVVALVDLLFGEDSQHIFDGLYYDLRHVNLVWFHIKLNKVKKEIDFRKANLEQTTFEGGDLSDCKFQETYLCHTNFQGTILRGMDFTKAELPRVHFYGADLSNAFFIKADLSNAVFAESTNLYKTTFLADLCYANLEETKHLETAVILAEYNDYTKFPEGYNPKNYKGWEYVAQ